MQDQVTAKGRLHVELLDADGGILKIREFDNLVVTSGLTFLAARAVGTPTIMSHMAVGTGTAAAALGNTALGAENGRVALSTSTSAANVITYTATFGPGVGTGSVSELGLFNASSAGTMLARTVFTAIPKDAPMTLTVTWTITLS